MIRFEDMCLETGRLWVLCLGIDVFFRNMGNRNRKFLKDQKLRLEDVFGLEIQNNFHLFCFIRKTASEALKLETSLTFGLL